MKATVPGLQLVRSWLDGEPATALAFPQHARREVTQAHPRIPKAALERLRAHCVDRRGGPIRWWHRDAAPWAAVRDLYLGDQGDTAHDLGLLLAWCSTRYEHDHVRFWEITEQLEQQTVGLFDIEERVR